MSDLAGLKLALTRQFIDLYQLSIPDGSLEEAIRRTLARLNLALGGRAVLAGLDGSAETSLPADWHLALLEGAAAQLLDYCLRSSLARGSTDGRDQLAFERRSDWLQAKFESSLEFLRSFGLQTSTEAPAKVWNWVEGGQWYEHP
ncbi:MAG: hypothetical protein VB108_07405 [Anaerolineaceae bacterium]|nr:hypothetical protein [Anaerolineaceae bacterium]